MHGNPNIKKECVCLSICTYNWNVLQISVANVQNAKMSNFTTINSEILEVTYTHKVGTNFMKLMAHFYHLRCLRVKSLAFIHCMMSVSCCVCCLQYIVITDCFYVFRLPPVMLIVSTRHYRFCPAWKSQSPHSINTFDNISMHFRNVIIFM